MNLSRIGSALSLSVALSTALPSLAQTAPNMQCRHMVGAFLMAPDPACNIVTAYSGPTYLGAMNVPNACFSVTVGGALFGTGYAGLTAEVMGSPMGGAAQTPGLLNEAGVAAANSEFGIAETRRMFTARTVLSLPGGKIYTADAGLINGADTVEQIVIARGEGAYQGAQGSFSVMAWPGMGRWQLYSGSLCLPR